MKQLKFYCPFHGRIWPLIAALVAAVAAWGFTLSHDWPEEIVRASLLFAPLIVLVCSYLFIQRLSPAERELVAKAEYPNWYPVTETVLRQVREQKRFMSEDMMRLLGTLGIFALASLLPGKRSEPNLGLSALFLLIGAIVYIANTLLRNKWQSVDQSAVMAKVPIDHMFDTVHYYGRRRWRWYFNFDTSLFERTTSYVVFYQPDGRYVLRAGAGSGNANTLIIVQYNGMLTWIPAHEMRQEDDMQ